MRKTLPSYSILCYSAIHAEDDWDHKLRNESAEKWNFCENKLRNIWFSNTHKECESEGNAQRDLPNLTFKKILKLNQEHNPSWAIFIATDHKDVDFDWRMAEKPDLEMTESEELLSQELLTSVASSSMRRFATLLRVKAKCDNGMLKLGTSTITRATKMSRQDASKRCKRTEFAGHNTEGSLQARDKRTFFWLPLAMI